jgi:hypothetical protein
LAFGDQEANFLEAFQFALNVTGVFFDQFGQSTDVRFEVGVLGVYHDNLAPNSGGNKYV